MNIISEINKILKNYELIKIKFPTKERMTTNNSIEIIPGKLQVLYTENDKDFMGTYNKQIINQENIIINNGFVNMNNNYYVNNSNINNNIDNDNFKKINDKYKNKLPNK